MRTYLDAVDKWIYESDRWQKAFLREVYILTRHCHFPPDFLWHIPPYWRNNLLDLWNEEQEAIKKQAEDMKKKQHGLITPGGPLGRGVRPSGIPANGSKRGPLV